MKLSPCLILLGLAFFLALASGACQDYLDCATCTDHPTEGCGFCPTTRKCIPKNEVCSTFMIFLRDGCTAGVEACNGVQCGENAVCNRLVVPNVCQCTNCTYADEKGQCTKSKCPADAMLCEKDQCVCKPGLTPIYESNGEIKCTDKSCGDFVSGCGPHSFCKGKECVCETGYVKAPAGNTGSNHPGCVLAPPTCESTCTYANASCVNDVCQCNPGFIPEGRGCKPVEVPPTQDCSASNCKDCSQKAGCLWCQNGDASSCVANNASVSTTCRGTSVFTAAQCACLSGCPDGQYCSNGGCVCKPGLEYVNGACRDPQNPCAIVTCRENEECKNELLSASNTTAPICRCVRGYTRVGDLCVAPTNSCPDPKECRCITIEGTNTQVCCKPPFDVDRITASCRIKCPDGSFVDDVTSCPCPEGLVHDLGNELCVKPCPDKTAPTFGRCGIKCPEGQSPNPKYVPGSEEPPCGFICQDGSFVLYKEKCLDGCATKPELYCPCEGDKVRDLVTKACVAPCPPLTASSEVIPPSNGKCPEKNFCPEGIPFPTATGKVECKRPCPDGSYVALTESCPVDNCPEGYVRDKATQACVEPCSDGSTPYNGNCPIICPNLVDCCASLGDPTRCPPPECEPGKKRNAEGVCVTPCPDGSLPSLKDGNCSTNATCPRPGFVLGPNDKCGVYCNSTHFALDPAECCPKDQVFSVATHVCLCKDGSVAVGGRCPITGDCQGTTCPCPAPLLRDASGKCACPDPKAYPDPYDGRRCGQSACPTGLVQLDSRCVCPITGQLPEKTLVGDREVVHCKCDPAKYDQCPLTPLNCEGSSFPKCLCLIHPTKEGCQSTFGLPTKESCLSYPSHPRCFCLLKPTARECLSAPLCVISPKDPSCLTGEGCTLEMVLKDKCSREEFCKNNLDHDVCACFRPGGCSQAGISFAEGVSYNDIKNAECTPADYKNQTNLPCYCQKSYDPKRCFCTLFPTDAKCLNPDGTAVVPSAEVNRNNTCQVVTKVPGAVSSQDPCTRGSTVEEKPTEVQIGLQEGNDLLSDEVRVNIKKGGDQPGLLSLSRRATKGTKAPSGATVDDSNISIDLGFVVTRCFELLDADGNGLVSDGDSIISELSFSDITWTTSQFTNDLGFTTVTLTSADGEIRLTYVISSDSTSLGADATAKPPRNTKFTLEINYPYELTTTNLVCEAKVITDVAVTFVNSVIRFGAKAEFSFEEQAESGSTVIPVKTSTVETTSADSHLVTGAGDRVFTVTLVVQGWAVPNLRYDPDLRTSAIAAQTSNFEQEEEGGNSAGVSLAPLFSLATALFLGAFALLF